MTEAEEVTALMESILDGERTAVEVSDLLEINLQAHRAGSGPDGRAAPGPPGDPAG